MALLIAIASLAATLPVAAELPKIYFQAHRGGVEEVPENSLPALEHAWGVAGAVPEVDLQTTADGVIVCMHDDTPARTTDAPAEWKDKPIREIPFAALRAWDAGVFFDAKYAGTRVPTLDEVFAAMHGKPDRQLYLDLKEVAMDTLLARIHETGLETQIIFVHGDPARCIELRALYDGARTMTWLSGPPEQLKARFEELAAGGFAGISQLQFHLTVRRRAPHIEYAIDDAYLRNAVRRATDAGVAFQARPFSFDAASLRRLIDLGIHWYVTDAPAAFAAAVQEALSLAPEQGAVPPK